MVKIRILSKRISLKKKTNVKDNIRYFIFLFLIITIDCYSQNKPVIKDSVKEVNPVKVDSINHVIDEPYGIIKIVTLVFR